MINKCRSKGLGWLALERVLFLGSIINEYTLQYGSWYSLEITPQLIVVIHPHKLFKSTYPHCCTAVRRASVWIDIRLLLVLNFFFQFSCLILLERGLQRGWTIGPFSAIPHSPLLHGRVDDWVNWKEMGLGNEWGYPRTLLSSAPGWPSCLF